MIKTWNKLRSVIKTAGARSAPAVAVCVYLTVFPLVAEAKININTAPLSELTTLIGVGEVIGQRIIDARPFSSIGDIKSVKGIGDATYDKFKNDITVSGSSVSGGNEGDSDGVDGNTNSGNKDDSEDRKNKNKVPIKDLHISVPTYVFVDEEVAFETKPVAGIRDRLIRYKWNFGDGTVGKGSSPIHRYKHPGTYVAVVESYYLGENIVAKKRLEVLPLKISLRRDIGGVVVINNSDKSINISGMKLVGQQDFVFPEHSWLLPKEELVIPVSKIRALPINTVTMHSSSGRLLASTYQRVEASSYTQVSNPEPVSVSSKDSLDEEVDEEENNTTSTTSPKKATATQAASASHSIPEGSLPFLGLIAVMGIGLIAVHFSVRQ